MKRIFLVAGSVLILAVPSPAQAQSAIPADTTVPFITGITRQLYSVVLGETRTLNIYLPQGYSPDSTYPVIYLLDGSAGEDFIHITGIVQFLTMTEQMPASIVVGIANSDRKKDFTFPTTVAADKKDFPTTGGSAAFMDFIEKELQPFIQKKYKTGRKTIIGQSLGGLFATEVLLKKSELFDQYIIVSPSLWWDNESLLKQAKSLLARQASHNLRVYISVGTEGKQMEDDAGELARTLQTSGRKNLHIDFLPLPAENHLTILHNSIYKGLILLYKKVK